MEAEKVIFSYLKSRGLKNTEQALKADVKHHVKYDINQNTSLEKCESIFLSLFLPLSDQFIEDTFYDSFLQYKIWTDSSLEIYKHDLQKFSVPLFTYMHLYLLKRQKEKEARLFFENFSNCLSLYDYNNLSSIQTENDLNSDFARRHYFYRYDDSYIKFIISIKKSSLLLFMSFIEENKLSSIMMIINLHIDIFLCSEMCEDYPAMLIDLDNYRNKSFLLLNTIIEEDKRREVKVPLPAVNQDHTNQKLSELEEKFDLINNLPYIICHNIKTGNRISSECTCMDISEDGCIIASGFEDSVIRI